MNKNGFYIGTYDIYEEGQYWPSPSVELYQDGILKMIYVPYSIEEVNSNSAVVFANIKGVDYCEIGLDYIQINDTKYSADNIPELVVLINTFTIPQHVELTLPRSFYFSNSPAA